MRLISAIFTLISISTFSQKIQYEFREDNTLLYVTSIRVKFEGEDLFKKIEKHKEINKLLNNSSSHRVRHSYKRYRRKKIKSKISFILLGGAGSRLILVSGLEIIGFPILIINFFVGKSIKSNAYFYLEDAIINHNNN